MFRVLQWVMLLGLFLVGCQQEIPVGGTPRPKSYKTAVSLSPGTSEIMSSYIFDAQLIGRTSACNSPGMAGVPIMGDVKPNYEKIAKAKPDIIVYDPKLYNANDIEKIKSLKIDTFEVTGDTIDSFIDSIRKLATKVGSETKINDYVERILAARAANLGENSAKRKIIILMGGNGEYMAAGEGSIQADIIRGCGYEPVGPSGNKFSVINAESLIRWNPDVIMVAGDVSQVSKDSRLQSLPAVKGGRVMRVDPDAILRSGTRIDQLLSNLRPAVEGLFKEI
ncbi:MAG: ABC transporter substrate-binding protein [Armatimonadetes bacterium]|nr:ABC transporter substrate-binding protein [Armatimonadota bacterium]